GPRQRPHPGHPLGRRLAPPGGGRRTDPAGIHRRDSRRGRHQLLGLERGHHRGQVTRTPGSITTPAAKTRRSSRILAAVVLLSTTAALAILGWTLFSVNDITRGLYDAQQDADGVAHVERDLLHLARDVLALDVGCDLG